MFKSKSVFRGLFYYRQMPQQESADFPISCYMNVLRCPSSKTLLSAQPSRGEQHTGIIGGEARVIWRGAWVNFSHSRDNYLSTIIPARSAAPRDQSMLRVSSPLEIFVFHYQIQNAHWLIPIYLHIDGDKIWIYIAICPQYDLSGLTTWTVALASEWGPVNSTEEKINFTFKIVN